MFQTLRDHFHRSLEKLGGLRDSPEAIAGGIAIGTLIGFTPLLSIKTLLALGLAWALRCNRIAAVIAVTLHDLLLPLSPFLARLEYGMGHWLLTTPHHWPPKIQSHDFHLSTWFHWDTLHDLVWPMLLGALIIAIPLSIIVYYVSLGIVRRHQARRSTPPHPTASSDEPSSLK